MTRTAGEARPWRRAAGVAGLLGLCVLADRFGASSPVAFAVLQMAKAIIAAVTAFLVVGRFRQSRSLVDLALVWSLALFATGNVVFGSSALVEAGHVPGPAESAQVLVRVTAAAALAAAAFPAGRVTVRSRWAGTSATVAAVAVVLLGGWIDGRGWVGPSVTLGAQVFIVGTYAAAVAGFAAKGRAGDSLMVFVAAGFALAGIGQALEVLDPLVGVGTYTADFARLAGYIVLLVGAEQELRSYWRVLAEVAVSDERQRMARDLHDGLGHELALLAFTGGTDVAVIAERARVEARSAIYGLRDDAPEPFVELVRRLGEDLAGRWGGAAKMELDDAWQLEPDVQRELLRVISEAVTNAYKHGDADVVWIRVDGLDRVVRIVDCGGGFDLGNVTSGFGLRTMRERAERVGGTFSIRSVIRAGTAVEVCL